MPEIVRADSGFDLNAIVAAVKRIGAEAVIPSKSLQTQPKTRTRYRKRRVAFGGNRRPGLRMATLGTMTFHAA